MQEPSELLRNLNELDFPADGEAVKSCELLSMLLSHTSNPYARDQFAPGHVTATGVVLAADGDRVLMVHHARLHRWLLPGGHLELEDADIFAAAAREVMEETAVAVNWPGRVVSIDVHGIPPKRKGGEIVEPYHQHHDILIAFRACNETVRISSESLAVSWVPPGDFHRLAVPGSIRRAYARAVILAST